MRVASVHLARALAFVESLDLNPKGHVYYPDLVAGIVDKYKFLKFPQALEDFDELKGVEFIGGKWGDVVVERLTIYQNGILLDTRASTDESERLIHEGLAWASSTFSLTFDVSMIKRRGYLSDLVFYSDCPSLLESFSPVANLNQRIYEAHSKISGDRTAWKPTKLEFFSESVPRKPMFAPFTIQRRADTPFSENKYFSEAPLPTDQHIALLKAFEAEVIAAAK